MKKKMVLLVSGILVITMLLSGCGWFESAKNSLKGSLIGVSYTAEFYDNYGARFLTVTGENIDIEGNKVKESGFDSDGNTITNYSLSSVITITIDGKQMSSCGNTVIFAESGLQRDVEFTMSDIDSESEGGLTGLTSVAKVVNKYKNYFGKPQVVVIQSQLGVPICAYSGNEVYWTIPEDLPKMTKLMIDGKALYIHRANFEIIDRDLIE
ncbi:MAG: DUF5052 family protein [Clostridia bacterium]